MIQETTPKYVNDKESKNYAVYKEDEESEEYRGYIQRYSKIDIHSSRSLEKLLTN